MLLAAGAKPEISQTLRLEPDLTGLIKELKLTDRNAWFSQTKYLEEHPEFKPKSRQ